MYAFSYVRKTFYSYELDLDSITLICEFALNILEMYMHTKNEVPTLMLSKVRTRNGQIDIRRPLKALPAAFASGNKGKSDSSLYCDNNNNNNSVFIQVDKPQPQQ